MDASKTQIRVLALFGKECDGTYDHASRILEEMGLPKNGCPEGYKIRQLSKLSDEELKQILMEKYQVKEDIGHVPDSEELRIQRVEAEKKAYYEWLERREEFYRKKRKRRMINEKLKAHGYRWVKMNQLELEEFEDEGLRGRAPIIYPGGWVLYDPEGRSTTVEKALKEIEEKD